MTDEEEASPEARLLARALIIVAVSLGAAIAFLLGSVVVGIGVRVFLSLAGIE